jgi:glucokinase-like ROK family protein
MKKATRRQTKAHNDRLILKTIYDKGEISRADIARLTGLTRTTVSDSVAAWMGDGLVTEVGPGPFTRGKPPILLSVVDDARHLIGIDLADSAFHGAVVDLRGGIAHHRSLPTDECDGDAALALVYELVDELVSAAGDSILGIGIGTPGLMDPRQRMVRNAVNLDWHDLPLGSLLEERYQLPVYIANDCQVAALAECTFGCGREVSNLIVVRVGRGVGAGIVLNRNLYYGDGCGAGEIGHVVVVDGGEQCRCGHRGCLETLVSTRAIVRRARAIAGCDPRSALHGFAGEQGRIGFDAVFSAFQAGDEQVRSLVTDVACTLGKAVAGLVCALNVECVVLAGTVTRFGEALIEPIRREVRRGALAALAEETQIQITELDPNIVVLGAAALTLNHELGLV